MSMRLEDTRVNELLFVSFNQDAKCFAVGTDDSFRIYTCEPFKEQFRRDFRSGGIGIVEMLFRCNLLALVGGGDSPRYPRNKVMIWDDFQNRCIGELSFRTDVMAVKLRKDRVVVVLNQKIYVYNFADMRLMDHIETVSNPKGLCAVCPDPSNNVIACPGLQKGSVRVELYDMRKTTLISAHESELAAIAVNQTGTRVATASDKGTLIRVFDAVNGQLVQELRRGADRALIHCIAFDASSRYIACTSDKGTVHVFKLRSMSEAASAGAGAGAGAGSGAGEGAAAGKGPGGEPENTRSTFAFMGRLARFFDSEWSFAKFRIPGFTGMRSVCAFGQEKNTLLVVTGDGAFFKVSFAAEGECEVKVHEMLIAKEEEAEHTEGGAEGEVGGGEEEGTGGGGGDGGSGDGGVESQASESAE